jgi:hypothetical protein
MEARTPGVPPTGPTAQELGLSPVEVQFIGEALNFAVRHISPHLLDALRNHISSVGLSVADEVQIQQETKRFETAFIPILGALAPAIIGGAADLVTHMTPRGQPAGTVRVPADGAASTAGTVGAAPWGR